jgi:1-acyl-sn-glycerol-3-phosphate acyltransferase
VPAPLIPPHEPRRVRRKRIAKSLAIEVTAFAALTVLAPAWLLAAGAVDAALWLRRRKPWTTVRLIAVLWWFLLGELKGLASLAATWLATGGPMSRDTPERRRRVFHLQVAWATGHLAAVTRLFQLRFEVEGDELVGEGPVIVLYRHTSIIDNALPALLLSRVHGLDLHYVLKDEMAAFPTLDIGGRWVPTSFVQRGSDDPQREIAKVRALATDLGRGQGVLIYPEGTRATPEKLATLKAREHDDPLLAERVGGFRHLLPPRLGGPLAAMEQAPHAAVLVVGHVGLDGLNTLGTLWDGRLLGRTVRVRIWRHEPEDLPADRATWLFDRWQELDDWVGGVRAEAGLEAVAA